MLTAIDVGLSALYILVGVYLIYSVKHEPRKAGEPYQNECDASSGVMLIIMGVLLALVRGGII